MRVKTLLIVYHSMTGGTAQMAQSAASGAGAEPAVAVRLLAAPAAQATDLLDADGYVFATPENLAAMSGLLKDFFDRTYYAVLDRLNGRPYATLICAGTRWTSNAVRQLRCGPSRRCRPCGARNRSRAPAARRGTDPACSGDA